MPKRAYLLLWSVCLFLLSLQAEPVRFPGYMDSAYYYHVAANLASGRGLVEDFVWNYLAGTPDLPAPANLYWMPLTSIVAAPALWLFEPSFRAAQLPFVLLGSLVPVFTLWLGWYLLRDARGALLAAVLTLFAGFYFGYWGALDSFSLFTLLTGAALVLFDRILGPRAAPGLVDPGALLPRGPSRNGKTPHTHALPVAAPLRSYFRPARLQAVAAAPGASPGLAPYPARSVLGHVPGAMILGWIAGLTVGAAHLTRADGALLLPVFGALLLSLRPRRWAAALAVGVGFSYLAIMGPWFLRGAGVSDTPLAALAVRTALLRDYDQLFAYAGLPSWDGFLSLGATGILASRWAALTGNLLDFFGGVYFLAPLTVLGLWQVRHRREWRPFLLYAALLYAVMSLVFALPGVRGSFRHSAAALVPWLAVATVVGLRTSVVWAAARLPHWEVERAMQGFGMVLAAGAALLSAVTLAGHLTTWQRAFDNYAELAAWLRRQEPSEAPVMVTNPPLFHYVTHQPAVTTPSDGLGAVLAVADRYGVVLLALEQDHARSLDALYRGEAQHHRLKPLGEAGRTRLFRIAPPSEG